MKTIIIPSDSSESEVESFQVDNTSISASAQSTQLHPQRDIQIIDLVSSDNEDDNKDQFRECSSHLIPSPRIRRGYAAIHSGSPKARSGKAASQDEDTPHIYASTYREIQRSEKVQLKTASSHTPLTPKSLPLSRTRSANISSPHAQINSPETDPKYHKRPSLCLQNHLDNTAAMQLTSPSTPLKPKSRTRVYHIPSDSDTERDSDDPLLIYTTSPSLHYRDPSNRCAKNWRRIAKSRRSKPSTSKVTLEDLSSDSDILIYVSDEPENQARPTVRSHKSKDTSHAQHNNKTTNLDPEPPIFLVRDEDSESNIQGTVGGKVKSKYNEKSADGVEAGSSNATNEADLIARTEFPIQNTLTTTDAAAANAFKPIIHPQLQHLESAAPLFPPDHNTYMQYPLSKMVPTTQPQPVYDPGPIDVDPTSSAIAHILDIVPDVELGYLETLVMESVQTYEHGAVEHVLHILLDDAAYPKVDKKGKGKRKRKSEEELEKSGAKFAKIDYGDKERLFTGGEHYTQLALEQLQMDFPYIPKNYIRKTMSDFNELYAPTHAFLLELEQVAKKQPLPYTRRKTAFRSRGKNQSITDKEFNKERDWVQALGRSDADGNLGKEKENESEEDEECEYGIECGCCFSTFPFEKMTQCPETHLFCRKCMITHTATRLGVQDTCIKCMHQSGCSAPIAGSELRRVLPEKLRALWERLSQRKEVQAAELEDLEECPFCDWACVIENPEEKLLRCANEETCGVVSCRACKEVDHLPKSCKEAEESKALDGRHAVEEAMSRALMRTCPKCKKPFIKDYGCNVMSCTCGMVSCYLCRKPLVGFNHMSCSKGGGGQSTVEALHRKEVKEARDRAMREYKRNHPEVNDAELSVELPTADVQPQRPGFYPLPPIVRALPAGANWVWGGGRFGVGGTPGLSQNSWAQQHPHWP